MCFLTVGGAAWRCKVSMQGFFAGICKNPQVCAPAEEFSSKVRICGQHKHHKNGSRGSSDCYVAGSTRSSDHRRMSQRRKNIGYLRLVLLDSWITLSESGLSKPPISRRKLAMSTQASGQARGRKLCRLFSTHVRFSAVNRNYTENRRTFIWPNVRPAETIMTRLSK